MSSTYRRSEELDREIYSLLKELTPDQLDAFYELAKLMAGMDADNTEQAI